VCPHFATAFFRRCEGGAGGTGSIVRHPALGLDLKTSAPHGIGKLRQDHGCELLSVALTSAGLIGESFRKDHSQWVERPQVHSSQRQPCGVKGIAGNGQSIDSIRAGWHGHPRVVGDAIHRTDEGKRNRVKLPSISQASRKSVARACARISRAHFHS